MQKSPHTIRGSAATATSAKVCHCSSHQHLTNSASIMLNTGVSTAAALLAAQPSTFYDGCHGSAFVSVKPQDIFNKTRASTKTRTKAALLLASRINTKVSIYSHLKMFWWLYEENVPKPLKDLLHYACFYLSLRILLWTVSSTRITESQLYAFAQLMLLFLGCGIEKWADFFFFCKMCDVTVKLTFDLVNVKCHHLIIFSHETSVSFSVMVKRIFNLS